MSNFKSSMLSVSIFCFLMTASASISAETNAVDSNNESQEKKYEEICSQADTVTMMVLKTMSLIGDADAQNQLGVVYSVCKNDIYRATEYFKKAAKKGNSFAQSNLGKMYYLGEKVERDYDKAVFYLKQAAEQEDSDAQVILAGCYRFGYGVEQSYSEYFKWIHRAANNNNVEAQYLVSSSYLKGEGVEKNREEAIFWVTKAADNNHSESQGMLSMLYYYGAASIGIDSINKDHQKAYEMSSKAAAQNDSVGLFILSKLLYDGQVVEKDTKRAVELLTRAAQLNYSAAQFELAQLYLSGDETTEVDVELAKEWFRKAESNGSARAAAALRKLEKRQPLEEATKSIEKATETIKSLGAEFKETERKVDENIKNLEKT